MCLKAEGNCRGFSLLEVLVSLGIFSFGTVIVVGMLGASLTRGRELSERAKMPSLMALVDSKMMELCFVDSEELGEEGFIGSTVEESLFFVADKGVNCVCLQNDRILSDADQFYLIEISLSKVEGLVSEDDQQFLLVFRVSVSWPYRFPSKDGFVEVERDTRETYQFLTTVRR